MKVLNIIIGGGLAGLLAALKLEKAKLPYVLLEAKSHLGGRIEGAKDIDSNHYHDLGPTWIFPHHKHTQSLLESLNINVYEQYNEGDMLYQLQRNQQVFRSSDTHRMSMYRLEGGMYKLIDEITNRLNQINMVRYY